VTGWLSDALGALPRPGTATSCQSANLLRGGILTSSCGRTLAITSRSVRANLAPSETGTAFRGGGQSKNVRLTGAPLRRVTPRTAATPASRRRAAAHAGHPRAADELGGTATARSLAGLHDCMRLHLSSGLPIRCAERTWSHCTRNQHAHLLLRCVPPCVLRARAFSVRAGRATLAK